MRHLFLAAAALAAAPGLFAQTRLYVTAPQVRLTSGSQVQLTAVARNSAGDIIPNATFFWSSSNSSVAPVDSSGTVSASALGLADITAAFAGATGVLRLQVLPQRIDISPANVSITFGSQQQFSAVAYDAKNQPIPNVNFTWHFGIYSGFDSSTVLIRNGLVTATTLGYFVVRAAVVYPSTAEQFQLEFDGQTPVTIVPEAKYSLKRLASNSDSKPQFSFRGKRTSIAAGEDGTVYLSGILDGLANGLMQVSNGSVTPLRLAGGPSFLPAVIQSDFEDPSVDSAGNVVALLSNWGSNSMVVEQTVEGDFFPLAMDGATISGLNVSNCYSNRYSLSDSGDAVFRCNASEAGSNVNQQSLFRYSNGIVQLEVSITDQLPGFNGTVNGFDNQFGIDSSGAIYFIARGTTSILYRKAARADPVKVLAVGDIINGNPVNGIYQTAMSRAGDIYAYTYGGQGYIIAVFSKGQPAPKVFALPSISTIFDVSATGTLLFSGDGGTGYGIYQWNPTQQASPQPLLLRGGSMPGGEPFYDVYWGAINSSNQVFATVRGVDSPWLLLALRPTPSILVSSGDPVFGTANLNLSPSLVPGDRTGPAHILAGGNQPSLFEVTRQGFKPVAVVNDRFPGGSLYSGTGLNKKTASGAIYIWTDSAIYRNDSSGVSLFQSLPLIVDGASLPAYNFAVNDSSQAVFFSGSLIAMVNPGSKPQTIANFAANGQGTPSPGGGSFSNFNEMAISEGGLVMANANVSGAPGGLFVYDGSTWTTACQLQTCTFDGEPVTSINQLRTAGNRFCAVFNNRLGRSSLRCWENGSWTAVITYGEITSDGTEVGFIGLYDVNQSGDVAALISTQGFGGPSIFRKSGDGYTTVLVSLFPTADGTTFRAINSIDLRNDGRVFFTGMDYNDQVLLYEADPIG